jgi:pyridoxine 5-phosphate synthase
MEGALVSLGVNVDHVANIRQARKAIEPDPVTAALLAELAGAHCITVHLRSDRRHIQARDLELLRKQVKTKLNLEMADTEEMIAIAGRIKPDMVTLVPERPEEVTTEGGLNVVSQQTLLKGAIARLQDFDIKVGIFIDPDPVQVEAAAACCAQYIEIHTGLYAAAKGEKQKAELQKIVEVAEKAAALGLGVNAGHDLTYTNVTPIAAIPQIEELNIGHNIIARAVLVGMERAVLQMLEVIQAAKRCC